MSQTTSGGPAKKYKSEFTCNHLVKIAQMALPPGESGIWVNTAAGAWRVLDSCGLQSPQLCAGNVLGM